MITITKQQLLDAVKMVKEIDFDKPNDIFNYFNGGEGLEYFAVGYNNKTNEVDIPNDLNLNEAIDIVDGCFEKMNNDDYKSKRSNEMVEKIDDYFNSIGYYDGGDDMDYYGTYVSICLEVIKIAINNQNNEGDVK